MNEIESSITQLGITVNERNNNRGWKGDTALFQVFLVGVSNDIGKNEMDMQKVLGIVFTDRKTVSDKKRLLREFGFEVEALGEELTIMCNLSMGILEKGLEQGLEQGELRGTIRTMRSFGKRNEEIIDYLVDVLDYEYDEAEKIIVQYDVLGL